MSFRPVPISAPRFPIRLGLEKESVPYTAFYGKIAGRRGIWLKMTLVQLCRVEPRCSNRGPSVQHMTADVLGQAGPKEEPVPCVEDEAIPLESLTGLFVGLTIL